MPTEVTSLSANITASASPAVAALDKAEEKLADVKSETLETAAAIEDLSETLKGITSGFSSLSKAASGLGLSNVGKKLKEIEKVALMGAGGLDAFSNSAEELASKLEKSGNIDLAKQLREAAKDPIKAEQELITKINEAKAAKEAEVAAAKQAAEAQKIAAESEKAYYELTEQAAKQAAKVKAAADAQARREQEIGARELAKAQNVAASEAARIKAAAAREAAAAEKAAAKQAAAEEKMQAQALAETKKQMRAIEAKAAKDKASVEKEAEKQTADAAKEAERRLKDAQKAVAGFGAAFTAPIRKIKNLIDSVKRIAFYRLIRTAIKGVTQATKEGLTNLKEYSSLFGTAFSPAVDNLRQHVLLLKNAFATALRPVIEALIPVLIRLCNWLVKVADFMAQVFSVLFGKVDENGRYTKAVLTDLEQGTDQAKKLKKELRSLMGFDEINRLDDNSDTGGGGTSQSSGSMFKQAEVSEEAKKWAERLRKVLDIIKKIVKTVVDFIKANPWVLKLVGIILAVVAAFKLWNKYLKPIFTVLGNIVSKIGLVPILIAAILIAFAMWGDKIKAFMDGAKGKVEAFFNSFKGVSAFANAVMEFLKLIVTTVMDVVGLIASIVYKLVRGDLKGAFEDLKELGRVLLTFLVKAVIGAINIVTGLIQDLLNVILLGVRWLWNTVLQPAINWLLRGLANIGVWLHNAVVNMKIGALKLVSFLLQKADDLLQTILKEVNKLVSWMNDTLGTNIKPIEFHINSTAVDDKIAELEKTKLPKIDETVEFVGKWKEPAKLNLQIDTSDALRKLGLLGQEADKVGRKLKEVNYGKRALITPEGQVLTYAQGGFPSVGSLFVAGENGAEWVGNIGGQTGVMNTEQMAQALYQAMSAALQANPQGGGDIYLDGEVIYRNTVRRNNNRVRATGRSALLT